MAEIWFYAEGKPAQDEEIDERPFEDCVTLLELKPERYLGQDPTQAAEEEEKISVDGRCLVVAVGEEEANPMGWRPGYYPSPLDVSDAFERLGIDPGDMLAE